MPDKLYCELLVEADRSGYESVGEVIRDALSLRYAVLQQIRAGHTELILRAPGTEGNQLEYPILGEKEGA